MNQEKENRPDSSTRNITPEQMREAWIRVTEQAEERASRDLAEWMAAREAAKAQQGEVKP